MASRRFAVIGLGRFGTSVALTLAKKGAEVIAIDINPDRIQDIHEEVAHSIAMDATDIKNLRAQNLQDVDTAVVSIGRDFESSLLCTVQLQELGIKRIITRAMTQTQKKIMEKMGTKEVISPEIEVGVSVAERIMNPGILTFLQLPDDYEIVELSTPPTVIGKTLADIDIRKRYHLNLITIMRAQTIKEKGEKPQKSIIGVPGADTKIIEGDTLVLMGKTNDIKRFIDVNQ